MDEIFNYVPQNNQVIPGLSHIEDMGDFLGIALNVLIGVGVSLSVVFIALAGLRFITAGGNPDDLDRARKALTYSIVALVLTVGSLALKIIFINSILGINDPLYTDPTPTL